MPGSTLLTWPHLNDSSSHSNGLQVNGLSSKSSSKHEQVVQANNAANSATAASGKQPAAVNTPVKPIEVNSESQMMPNFVKDNFVGKSVSWHKTKLARWVIWCMPFAQLMRYSIQIPLTQIVNDYELNFYGECPK